jgi:phospholipid transport system substrate-binding protein
VILKLSKVLVVIGFACVSSFGAISISCADTSVKKVSVSPNKLVVVNPYNFLTNNFNKLQAEIKTSKASFEKNPDKLYNVIKEVVLPNIAVNQMAGTVLGPKWRKATPKQRHEFIAEFSKLLTRSYAIALLKVTHYEVKIRPLRGTSWKTQQVVSLQAKIINKSNGQSSNSTFYLKKSGNSWKIFDLAVEGVSIVKNFREQFDSFKSMKVLLDKMKVLNKAAEASK